MVRFLPLSDNAANMEDAALPHFAHGNAPRAFDGRLCSFPGASTGLGVSPQHFNAMLPRDGIFGGGAELELASLERPESTQASAEYPPEVRQHRAHPAPRAS